MSRQKKTTTVSTKAVKQADKSPALDVRKEKFLALLAAEGFLSEYTDAGGILWWKKFRTRISVTKDRYTST